MRKEILEKIDNTIEKLKVIKMEKAKEDAYFLKLENYNIELNNGMKFQREKLLKNKRDGSAILILPMISENEVLLNIEPRVFTNRTVGVGITAGLIDDGEEAIVAAKRELREETGYQDAELIEVGTFYQDPATSTALIHSYIAKNLKNKKEQEFDDDEIIENIVVTLDELEELIDLGYVQDASTLLTISLVKRYYEKQK